MTKRILAAAVFAGFAAAPACAESLSKPDKVVVCAACHGENGVSISPAFPNLAGQQRNYLERALRQYKSGERKNAIMGAQATGLSEGEIKQLAAWFAGQTPVLYTPDPEPKEGAKKSEPPAAK